MIIVITVVPMARGISCVFSIDFNLSQLVRIFMFIYELDDILVKYLPQWNSICNYKENPHITEKRFTNYIFFNIKI